MKQQKFLPPQKTIRNPFTISNPYTFHPLFFLLTTIAHKTARVPVASKRKIPLHNCTPIKFVRPFSLVSSAPAIGAPISVATLLALHDMPSRVPNRDISVVILANAAAGKVTRPAEKKPA